MSYSVYINSALINDEPIGLADASLKIMRGDGLDGISSSFVSDIQFWGDGYAVLKGIAESSGPCQTISVRIEENCLNGVEFDGLIYVSDIEFDLRECTANTAIEDDSLQSRVARFATIKAPFGSDKSVNGVAITPYSGADISVPGRTPSTIKGFALKDSLTYLMKYLTDNQAVTSFNGAFNVDYNYVEYELDCTLVLVTNPSTVDFEWTDIYGQTQTLSCPIISPANDNAYAAQIATGFATPSMQPFGNGIGPFYLDRPVVAPYTGNTLVFRFWNANANLKLVSTNGTGLINGSAGPIVFTPSQSGSYGFQNVFMTNGGFMNSSSTAADEFSTSWEEMQTLLSMYNVSIEYDGNNVNFYQEKDTFNATASATISNIYRTTLSYNEPLAVSSVAFSQPYQSASVVDYYALSRPIGYAGIDCSEESARVAPIFNFGMTFDFIDSAKAGTWDTDSMYLFEAVGGDIAVYEIREGTSLLGRSHFSSGLHPFVAKSYSFKNPSGLSYEDKVVANTEAIKIRKQATFAHPISNVQMQAIKADPKKAIIFDSEKGYIKELTYSLKTGLTEFNLLVE